MQKGRVFVTLWREVKFHKEIKVIVHAEDVKRYTSNIIKNKLRDVGYNLQFPSARLEFNYGDTSCILTVKLLVNQLDSIPIDKL